MSADAPLTREENLQRCGDEITAAVKKCEARGATVGEVMGLCAGIFAGAAIAVGFTDDQIRALFEQVLKQAHDGQFARPAGHA